MPLERIELDYTKFGETPFQRELFHLIAKNGPSDREYLCEVTGRARTTVYDSLAKLLARGIIGRIYQGQKKRGRPKTLFCLPQYCQE